VRAAKMVPRGAQSGPMSSMYPPEEWTNAELRYWYRAAQPALKVARLGLRKPFGREANRSYFSVGFRSNALLREAARTLSSASYVMERQGRLFEAASYSLDCMELAKKCEHDGDLIDSMVAVATGSIGMQSLEDLLPQLNEQELDAVSGRLRKLANDRTPLADIITEKKYSHLGAEVDVIKNYGIGDCISAPPASSEFRQWVTDTKYGLNYCFKNKRAMLLSDQRVFEEIIKECRGPYRKKSSVHLTDSVVFSNDIFHSFWNIYSCYTGQLLLFETYVAILRYQKATGHYSKTLWKLVPRYLPSVPVDPFGGATRPPLRYRLRGSSFLLYSVGSDMHDDGGKAVRPNKHLALGDFVAGQMFVRERYAPPRPKDHKDLPG